MQDQIPWIEITGILEKEGVVVLQEDYTEWSGFLLGQEGQADFETGLAETKSECGMYEVIPHILRLSWYRFPTGWYEVIAYLS